MDGLKFLFKLTSLSESVRSAFSSSVKSDYGEEKEEKENRFWKFDLSAPDVKSASRNQLLYVFPDLSVSGHRTFRSIIPSGIVIKNK